MTPSKTDHGYRRDIILGIVVNEYIKTVNPVSSGRIVQSYTLDLSSATIRNILAELEQIGYLTHPHTSAGRIPTQMGYRYYVDNLMNEIKLLEEEKLRIKEAYQRDVKDLECLLDHTSQAISELTQYTSIISVDGWGDRIVCRGTGHVVEYIDPNELNQIRNILVALEEKQRILNVINQDITERIKIYIGHEMSLVNVESCSLAVSSFESESGQRGKIAVLGPTRMDYQRVVSALDYCVKIMREAL